MLRRAYFILIDGEPVPCDDLEVWGFWFETTNRSLVQDEIRGIQISTVFLGLDHNFYDKGPPILWETMIFGGEHDGHQRRYATAAAALAGHQEAIALVRSTVEP